MEKASIKQKHLNSTQVAQTSLLIDILKKKPYQKIGALITQLGITKSKISERTFYRLVDKLFIIYGIKITFDFSLGGYFLDENESSNTESFLSHLEILATAELFTSNFEDKSNPLALVEFETKAITATIPNFKNVLNAIQQQLPITRYSDESTPPIPEQSTPRFRNKVRHLFQSKVHQSNRPLSSLSKDDIFQS